MDHVADRSDGFVTTNMSEAQMAVLIEQENGITVAEETGRIYAFAMAGSWAYWSEWPFFAYMIQLLPQYSFNGVQLTTENSYQYGPVCIDRQVRGTGIFEQIFQASLRSMQARYPYMATFINQINPRSYQAHTRKGQMVEVGKFDFNSNHYYLMACFTNAEKNETGSGTMLRLNKSGDDPR